MKQLYLICFVFSLSLLACKKNGGNDNSNNYYVTATIDGKDTKFILPVGDTTSGTSAITVYGFTDSTKNKYVWFEIENAKVGTENYTSMGYLDYISTGVDAYVGADQTNTVTVTYIDKNVVEGTFSGTASNRRQDQNTGQYYTYQTMHITNGKFRVKLGKF
jgi:hypothetical protein